LGELEGGQSVVVNLFPQAEGCAFNVVIGNMPTSHLGCIAWKLSEKKTAFTLDPSVFLLGHIFNCSHDLGYENLVSMVFLAWDEKFVVRR